MYEKQASAFSFANEEHTGTELHVGNDGLRDMLTGKHERQNGGVKVNLWFFYLQGIAFLRKLVFKYFH